VGNKSRPRILTRFVETFIIEQLDLDRLDDLLNSHGFCRQIVISNCNVCILTWQFSA